MFFPSSYLIAFVMITSSADIDYDNLKCSPEVFNIIKEPLKRIGVELEIIDEREIGKDDDPYSYWQLFSTIENFPSNLRTVRNRYQDLKDAPKAIEVNRLPDKKMALDCLSFNYKYRRQIEEMQQLYPQTHPKWLAYAKCIDEAEDCYRVWEAVADSRHTYNYVFVRRKALKNLRNLIGYEAFSKGQLPPAVPTWRFVVDQ